jgi:hypothetical protein
MADAHRSASRATHGVNPALALPLMFEPVPAAAGSVKYVANGGTYSIVVDDRGALVIPDAAKEPGATPLRLVFVNGRAVSLTGKGGTSAVANHLVGPQERWRVGVPLHPAVRLSEVWPGLDVVLYGNARRLEYDFIVRPGTSPSVICVRYEGAASVRFDERGDLLVQTSEGILRQHRPYAYQEDDQGRRAEIPSRYELDEQGNVRVRLGAYDTRRTLVIDPVLSYATYLGGPGGEFWVESALAGVAVDAAGNVLVAGDTSSAMFGQEVVQDLRYEPSGRDIFIARLNPTGTALLSITYLGGNGLDDRASLVRAGDGTLFLAGRTQSGNLPASVAARQSMRSGIQDAFVARLDAAAQTILYLTYLGGSGADFANALAVTASNEAIVVGGTDSADFPVSGTVSQPTFGGTTDAFVARLNSLGSELVYSTFLGGMATDFAVGVGLGAGESVYVAGHTRSANFPLQHSLQPALRGAADAFVTGLSPTGQRLFSTLLGGTAGTTVETATKLASRNGTMVVVGMTDSADLVTSAAVQAMSGGLLDGFAVGLSWTGTTLTQLYGTYLGGVGNDAAFGVALRATGAAVLTGATSSPTFPPDVDAFDTSLGGLQDAFVLELTASGSSYVFATYYGGADVDTGLSVVVDAQGDVFVVGQTTSSDLFTIASGGGVAYDNSPNGAEDAFVMRLSTDQDRDGLPDAWEGQWGLDPADATGRHGAEGDGDRDSRSNLDEFRGGTSPIESQLYFAEGATGGAVGFHTRFAILNPHADVAFDVTMDFQTGGQETFTHVIPNVLPGQRITVDASAVPGIPELAQAEFSTVIRSPFGVVADRTMTWNTNHYGSHAETAVREPSTVWYLAEGATHSDFDLFYLLQNPGTTAAEVRVTYLRAAPDPPLVKTYLVQPRSRFNIWVNQERFPDNRGSAVLSRSEMSAVVEVTNGVPIIVERAMYRTQPGRPIFSAGHASAAVTRTSPRWFLAEGATNEDFFDLFILVANPSDTDAIVRVTYLLPDGATVVQQHGGAGTAGPIRAKSRETIWVDFQDPRLANTAVSTIVESLNGVGLVVERAMWWPGPTPASWTEAHNSFGTTETGTVWAVAEGQQGGPEGADTYILIANTSASAGRARLTLHYEDGTSDATLVDLPPSSRTTVGVGTLGFAKTADARFGTTIEALPAPGGDGTIPQIVVEQAMYSADTSRSSQADFPAGRPYWPAGSNALATKLQ